MSKYNIVYKITNELNGKIYIGCHQTENLDDGYMGSGTYLKRALKKHGVENFSKEILFKFNSFDIMFEKEAELVNEDFVKRQDTYNLQLGGKGWNTNNLVTVEDKDGNYFKVHREDPRYLSGELVSSMKNKVSVKDKDGNILQVGKDDPRYLSGELIFIHKGKVSVKDKNNKCYLVDVNDPKYLSGELIHICKNTVCVKDKNNNMFRVSNNDPRYLSGELVHNTTGNKLSKEHREKISKANKISQSGKLNSQYGTCWINKEGIAKKIKKEDLDSYLDKGWLKGRKNKL